MDVVFSGGVGSKRVSGARVHVSEWSGLPWGCAWRVTEVDP